MKKLTLLFFLTLLPLWANAYDVEIGGIYYNLDNTAKTATVTYLYYSTSTYKNNQYTYKGNIIIPESIIIGSSSYTVTSIGDLAFVYCSDLTSITIPNSVTSIRSEAFKGCSSLNSVTIPNSVTSIGSEAFKGCSSLNSVTIPNSVTSIGSSAFSGCSGLNSITIPNSVTSIGNSAFSYCSGLNSITIPNSVTSIGDYAFNGCSGLTSVTIPNSVTSIGGGAFYNTQLSTFIVGTGVLSFGDKVFSTRPIKTIWLTNTPPSGYSAAAGTINYVPNDQYSSMSNKAEYKFLSSMFEVDGVVYVPVSPSERTCDAIDCIYDESVTEIHVNSTISYKGIEMSVQTLRPYTFYRNSYLQDVDLNFIGSVKNNTFYGCSNLRSVKIGKSITGIGGYAFSYCNALEKIIVPESVQTIDQYAFKDCISMGSVVIGGRSTIIEQYAFSGCKGMTSVVIGDGSKTIANNVFEGCTHLETVVIGDGNTSIGQSAFYGCTGLASVNIGDGTSSIGQSAFHGCKNLTSLGLGNGTTSISGGAFSGCSALPSITIPGSVNSIESNAFKGCTSLKEVIMADRDTQGELKLGSNGSNPLFADCPLDSVYIGRNISYKTTSSYGYSPFYRNTSLRAVVITDREEEISENEFYGCTNLQSVQIGDGVTTIGNRAFSGCSKLQSFGFGTQVKTIGTEAFSDCTAMTEFVSKATTPPTCGAQALDDVNKWTCKLIVPKGSVEAYQGANQWKDFFFMEEGDESGSTPVEPSEKKCDKPAISYADGKLTFSCETENVVFHSDITDADIRQYETAEVELSVTYTISVYATRNGYADSDVVTATLCWIDAAPQGEGVETDVTQLQAKAVLIQGRNGIVTIEGVEVGTAVAVYNLSGQMVATTSTNDGQTTIATPLRRGDIAIIKIGDRAVKARMQ